MKSIWNDIKERIIFEEQNGDIKTDVLIIGGGISGILCGYMLKSAGVDCVIVEADRICKGTTGNTTAKVTVQHGLIYQSMIKAFGVEKAKLYYQAQSMAFDKIKELCGSIPCDFEERDSYVYSINNREKIENEVTSLEKIGCNADFCEKTELPFDVAGAVRIKNQAQFHPLKFAYAIAKELEIYEKTKVTELRPDCIVTNRGKIKADRIIIATHFPIINKHGGYFVKMYQHRSYVLALKNAPRLDGMYVDEDKKGLSFRCYENLMLLGGGGHRTGKDGGGWKELSEFAAKYYPDAYEVTRWAAQDCMTLDEIPYIGEYSKRTSSMYVTTGFNKWGMTSSMVSAMILSDLVCGKNNEFAEVFSPSRSILRPQLAVNSFESIIGLLNLKTPRCPHLGCALKYNAQEHSWDCPCHGSRFTQNGELIENPATDDMNM